MVKHAFAENFKGSAVDAGQGLIKGVAVITEGIANGEVVDSTTLQQIMDCARSYENGLKVKADHRSGIMEVAGFLRNFRIDGKTLRADLYILESESNRDKILEMAQKIPDTFGLSVAFSGPQYVMGGQSYARCSEIYSADLVTEPAANPTGLFSKRLDASANSNSMATPTNNPTDPSATGGPVLTPSQILKQCEDMITKFSADMMAKIGAPGAPAARNPDDGFSPASQAQQMGKLEAALKELSDKNAALAKELSEFKASGLKDAAGVVAKEFAKEIGSSPAVLAAISTGIVEETTKGADTHVSLAIKHYEKTGSKVKAVELAMSEDPKAYSLFRESGKSYNWPRK